MSVTSAAGTAKSNLSGGMDSAKAAGLIAIGAVVVLALLRRGFAGVRVGIGD